MVLLADFMPAALNIEDHVSAEFEYIKIIYPIQEICEARFCHALMIPWCITNLSQPP